MLANGPAAWAKRVRDAVNRSWQMSRERGRLRLRPFGPIITACYMHMHANHAYAFPGVATMPKALTAPNAAHTAIDTALIARGADCAYANLKMLTRAVTTVYDEALRPVGLRASQLALMWAIVAREPIEVGQLGVATLTDQSTLSRTIAKLRAAGLVSVRGTRDGRVKALQLTAAGRERFKAAMPLWEAAQRRVADHLSVDLLRRLARRVHRASRAAA
jgi:DNA-binding MarR family transcriptional regulator